MTEATGDTGAAAAAAAAAVAAAAGGGTNTPAEPWYKGKADDETLGYLQNRIAKGDDAVAAAIKMTKAHMESSKLLGVPPERIVKLPTKDDDVEGWNSVYQKLGAPAKPEEYKFDGIKFKDGSELDEGFIDFARKQAAALHLSVNGAKQLTQELVKYMDTAEEGEIAETSATLTAQKATLAKNWGQGFQANHFIASQAAQRLGFTQQEIAGLEKIVGYDRIMEAFRVIGTKMGEDVFVQGSGTTGGGLMTREQAVSRLAELKGDKAWVDRYMAGGSKEKQEMSALQNLIHGKAA